MVIKNKDAPIEQQRASAQFFKSEASSSILLLICTIAALTWTNSSWSASYFELLNAKLGFSWNDLKSVLSWSHWINDGLMTLFFFVVGLEIKREVLVGQLSTLKKAVLPLAAAIGGMVPPAIIYVALNRGGAGERGWGIPMATDIAFALGVLALLGRRLPAGLKVFLAALAIADDLGAVLVIALFYTGRISVGPLMVAGLLLGLLFLAVRLNVRFVPVYGVLVIGVWLGVLASGIHATVAGILVSMVVPVRGRIRPKQFFVIARRQLAKLQASDLDGENPKLNSLHIAILERLHRATSEVVPAGTTFEHCLHPVTAFVILPLFALFNAGVVLDYRIVEVLGDPVGLGVLFGLLLGKPLGITAMSWIVIRLGLADMPPHVTWRQICGVSTLAGIGFTMALFISDLAIEEEALRGVAKIGILTASGVAAAVGYAILRHARPPAVAAPSGN